MKETERRRRSSRHPLRWEAAVVFDKAQGKPVVHTQTQDLSVAGAAIFSQYGDLTGSDVTLLLAHPPRKGGQAPKVLKVRAHVASTARTPGMSKFRHGLSFIRSPDDGLATLAEILNSTAAVTPRGEPAAPAPATEPAVSVAGSRLAQLKRLAQAKLAQGKKIDPQVAIDEHLSDALRRAHRYLKDLAEQLNVVTPAYPRGYAIAGVPEFNGLAWEAGHADFHTRESSPTLTLYDWVSLRFRLSGKKQIRVAREYPGSEKLKQLLADCKIDFAKQEARNARGSIERTTFVFPCEVTASLLLLGQFDTGKLLLRTINVSGFGAMEQILAPEAITEESLDELTGFILGESSRLGPLLLRNA
jgi:hypothetical protein